MEDQSNIKLVHRIYKLRCIECEKGQAKTGSPMLKQKFEIFGDQQDILNGMQLYDNRVLTDKSIFFVNQQRNALGLPEAAKGSLDSIDPLQYRGLEGSAICDSEEIVEKNPETGEVLINPNTGKPVSSYKRSIQKWLARS